VVRLLNPGGTTRLAITPYPGYVGGINAAAGDVNHDGTADLVIAANVGGHVRVYDGNTGSLLRDFVAYPGYGGPINVAAGDLNNDGYADVIVGANVNGHVRVFDGQTGVMTRNFFAYAGYVGPVSLAAADLGHGEVDLITAANGFGVHVKAFAPDTMTLRDSFLATGPGWGGNFSIAAGDLDGDGVAEYVVSQGPVVRVLDSRTKAVRAAFVTFAGYTGRLHVTAAQYDSDAPAEIVAIADVVSRSVVKVYDGPNFGVDDVFLADAR
jgi:hypothetical protein